MQPIRGNTKVDFSRVLTAGSSAPPDHPSAGDIHVVGNLASGAWNGHDHQVALFTGKRWEFTLPLEATKVWVSDGSECVFHQGTWHKTVDLQVPMQGPECHDETATNLVTTTSKSFFGASVAGMAWTPPAGKYLVTFSANMWNLANTGCVLAANRVYTFITSAGAKVPTSHRTAPAAAQATVTVDGTEEVAVRWYVQGGTGSMAQRTLSLQKVT